MARHSNHSLTLHTVDMGSAVTVGTLTNLSHTPGTTIVAPDTGGVFDVMQIVTGQQPQIPWGTLAVKTILENLALIGKCIDSDGTHPGVVVYAQSHDPCEALARGAAGTHMSLTCGDGHFVITQITASLGGFVTVTGMLYCTKPDGSAYPIVVALNANLPSSPITNELYGLGKAQILGTTVDRITEVSIDFSPNVELSNDAGTIWPTLVDVIKVSPTTTITTEDPAWVDAGRVGTAGKFETGSTSFVHFLKHTVNGTPTSGGSFEDFAAGNHIKGTLRGMVDVAEPYSASGTGISTTQIRVSPIYDLVTAPLVWDLASTYTL